MSLSPIGISAFAIALPSNIRTNDYWRQKYPQLVAMAEEKTLARTFSPIEPSSKTLLFDEEMQPFLADPFRGTIERRILANGETALMLESRAARSALAALKMSPGDIDLMICCSFLPAQIGPGNAAFLCNELEFQGTAWNLESTCSSVLQALHTAAALVKAEQYRNVLVVVSCSYSLYAEESDSLSWFLGDGAGAFVISRLNAGEGILGVKSINTADTCGTFYYELAKDANGEPCIRMGASKNTSKRLRENGQDSVQKCCQAAAKKAGVTLKDIDFFVFNTPLPWYARFCARALDVDPERTISTYPLYANVGPVLPAVNLYHAVKERKINKGDLVMLYTVGSVSSAGAMVMRWGDVKLGE
ncbi:MAG: 3-oxoacyl-[acyl-carrier-protein] synthase III C-terminal domain-containing protein [Acidobacteriota bacterium]